MNSPVSFLMKLTQVSLSAQVMTLGVFVGIGAMTALSYSHYENSSLKHLRASDDQIKDAQKTDEDLERRKEHARKRIGIREEILQDVISGKLSKEAAAQQYLELNRAERAIIDTLRHTYSSSDDLDCARKQLEQHLQSLESDS